MKKRRIKIEVSSRHIHLSKKDLEKLFGKNYQLRVRNNLSQRGEFASQETVVLKSKDREILNVRVLGPLREKTQIEISCTDAINLRIDPPVKISGDLKNTPGLTVIGPQGKINLKEGVIIAARHIHLNSLQAKNFGLKNNQIVSVKTKGKRSLIFKNVRVRIAPNFVWRMHIDTDEANAADLKNGDTGQILI